MIVSCNTIGGLFVSNDIVLVERSPAHKPGFSCNTFPSTANSRYLKKLVTGSLRQDKSLLLGFTHASALYRYGQPNDPEQSLLLNHYGSYIYEEWIFENVMAVDLRHYWTKKTRSGQYKTRYVAVLNRFALTRWDYTTAIISNTLYTSSDDDLWNGASPWIPLDFDDLRPRYENSYRFGLAYGRRRRLPVTSYFKYREFAVAGVVRYDRWREQTLLIPQLKWTFIY